MGEKNVTVKFLLRDYTPQGYKKIDGPLSRNRELSYVPWAMTSQGEVVYAPVAEARGKANAPNLRPYDMIVSQNRRKLCHSMLGMIALKKTEFSFPAVQAVTSGLLWFLFRRNQADPIATKQLFGEKVGKYLYGMRYKSFGRLSDSAAAGGDVQMWNEALAALRAGKPLETVLNIHEGVGRLLLTPKDVEFGVYDSWAKKLRAEGKGEMIHPDWRGREKKADGEYAATSLPGNVSLAMLEYTEYKDLQVRNRGTDMYNRIAPNARPVFAGPVRIGEKAKLIPIDAKKSGNVYFEQLGLRNELFGAGASGTTGTALASAFAFGKFDSGERLRQYLFAIIGYLVGGGMHSLHESLSILRLIGLEYNTGTMLGYDFSKSPAQSDAQGLVHGQVSKHFPLLPKKFVESKDFEAWRDEYYDIVILGGTHWKFNKAD